MAVTFKLITHTNQHGYGVSLMKYDQLTGDLEGGYVLHNFTSKMDRLKFLAEFAPFTGFEIEHLNDGEAATCSGHTAK